ncbi:hypothetical protein [Rufibacter sp. XAAS-G3-1]|uniref:hypothetical protein n=1 Tax=Rufibacter sp. XAAS-G3-1 TaxID=2729134 RepID=UPI0015E7DB00|nr:hypothetical protein [Rufibacter sp. XAAS-G3-1]
MDNALMEAVTEAVQKKTSQRIQYYSDINEFITVTAMIKRVEEKSGKLTLELATGEEIRFDQLVRVGKVAADSYDSGYFKCDL